MTSPISDILTNLGQQYQADDGEPLKIGELSYVEQAEEAILNVIAEAIGEDYELPSQFIPPVDMPHTMLGMWERNQLRAEIRAKLGIPTEPTQ